MFSEYVNELRSGMECDEEPTPDAVPGAIDQPAEVAPLELQSAISTPGADAPDQVVPSPNISVPVSAKKAVRRFSSIDISSEAKRGAKKSQLEVSGLPVLEGARQHRSSSLQNSLQHSASMASTSIHVPVFSRRGRLSMAVGNQDATLSAQPKLAKRSTTLILSKRGDDGYLGKNDKTIEHETIADTFIEPSQENDSFT
jgi:hypothetical protein